jgi:hypothetical protein
MFYTQVGRSNLLVYLLKLYIFLYIAFFHSKLPIRRSHFAAQAAESQLPSTGYQMAAVSLVLSSSVDERKRRKKERQGVKTY